METFFLLYLVFAIENIASFLEAFGALGVLILSGVVVLCIILGMAYSDSHGYDSYREYIQPYKRTIKNLVI